MHAKSLDILYRWLYACDAMPIVLGYKLHDWMYNFMTGCTTLVAKHHNAVCISEMCSSEIVVTNTTNCSQITYMINTIKHYQFLHGNITSSHINKSIPTPQTYFTFTIHFFIWTNTSSSCTTTIIKHIQRMHFKALQYHILYWSKF